MQITHFWLATSPKGWFLSIITKLISSLNKNSEPDKVEMTLDANIWFEVEELNGDLPEFIYADLCVSPPWESSTYQSTTTNAGNLT